MTLISLNIFEYLCFNPLVGQNQIFKYFNVRLHLCDCVAFKFTVIINITIYCIFRPVCVTLMIVPHTHTHTRTLALVEVGPPVELALGHVGLTGDGGGAAVRQRAAHLRVQGRLRRAIHAVELSRICRGQQRVNSSSLWRPELWAQVLLS